MQRCREEFPTCRRQQHAPPVDANEVVSQRVFPHSQSRARGLPDLDCLGIASWLLHYPHEQLNGWGDYGRQLVHPSGVPPAQPLLDLRDKLVGGGLEGLAVPPDSRDALSEVR